jgi:hypothetical protein
MILLPCDGEGELVALQLEVASNADFLPKADLSLTYQQNFEHEGQRRCHVGTARLRWERGRWTRDNTGEKWFEEGWAVVDDPRLQLERFANCQILKLALDTVGSLLKRERDRATAGLLAI